MKKSLIALSAIALCMSSAVGDTGGTDTGTTTPKPVPGNMSFADYMPLAMRTCKPLPSAQHLMHGELGLITEVGELGDNVKKHIIYGKPFDAVNLMEEVADCCWYLAIWMHEKGIGGKVVDRAIEDTLEKGLTNGGLKAEIAADPWQAVEAVKILSAMVSVMGLAPQDKQMTDVQSVQLVAALLVSFLDYAGYTMADALATNVKKLQKRYPGDIFSAEHALNRDTGAERAVLENGKAS